MNLKVCVPCIYQKNLSLSLCQKPDFFFPKCNHLTKSKSNCRSLPTSKIAGRVTTWKFWWWQVSLLTSWTTSLGRIRTIVWLRPGSILIGSSLKVTLPLLVSCSVTRPPPPNSSLLVYGFKAGDDANILELMCLVVVSCYSLVWKVTEKEKWMKLYWLGFLASSRGGQLYKSMSWHKIEGASWSWGFEGWIS